MRESPRKRPPTVFPADRIPRGDADLGLAVATAVDVHPEDVLARLVVEEDLGALDDAIGAEVAGALAARQQRALVRPPHEVRRREAVDVGEGRAALLVLADQVEGAVHADHAPAVRVEMLAVGLRGRVAARVSVLWLCRGVCGLGGGRMRRTAVHVPPGAISRDPRTGQAASRKDRAKRRSMVRRPLLCAAHDASIQAPWRRRTMVAGSTRTGKTEGEVSCDVFRSGRAHPRRRASPLGVLQKSDMRASPGSREGPGMRSSREE